MKSSRCRDDGEMYGKGLALTLACTSPLFLQPAVHFARFLAAGFTPAMHFDQFLAGSRALRLIPCGRTHPRRALPGFSCRLPCTSPVSLQGRNFVQGKRGSARQKALRMPVSACISAVFLQLAVHFACFLARVRAVARIWGKCTSSCRNRGEVHGCLAVARPARIRPPSRFSPPQPRKRRRQVEAHSQLVGSNRRFLLARLGGGNKRGDSTRRLPGACTAKGMETMRSAYNTGRWANGTERQAAVPDSCTCWHSPRDRRSMTWILKSV